MEEEVTSVIHHPRYNEMDLDMFAMNVRIFRSKTRT